MTKTEFLQELYNHLQTLPKNERDEIIQDFEEHFSAGEENGKTEEQICAELGNPYNCALQYLRQPAGNTQGNTCRKTNEPSKAPYGNTQPYSPTGNAAGVENDNERRNKFLWGLLFVFFVICAVGVYPASVGLMISPVIIIIGMFFAYSAVHSAAMIGLMISVSAALFAAGLLAFLIMTVLIKLSYRKSGI